MKVKAIYLLITLSFLFQLTQSKRILGLIAAASYSHQVFYQPIWRELALRGHEVVIITTDPTGENLPNLKEVSIRETYPLFKSMMNLLINTSYVDLLLSGALMSKPLEMIDFQLSLPQIQEILGNKTEHFDLIITECYSPLPFALKYRFNAPIIGVGSMDALPFSHAAMGNPTHSILYPVSLFPYQDDLTFFQRLFVFSLTNIMDFAITIAKNDMNALVKKHLGDGIPCVTQLANEMDMLFLNINPVFSPVRPLTPSTISLAGGIHIKPKKALPKDLEQFMDSAKEGVVYLSLGTNVLSNELSTEFRQTIIQTIAQLPYKVLWKYESDSMPDKPANVKLIKWAPQQDVLRHPNLKLFINQGGAQSLEEALYSYIPVVVIPFFGDQNANSEKVKNKGLGLVLDRYRMNVEEFKSTIIEVITNRKYKERVEYLAKLIQDTPMKPLDRAVWWIEYVLRHKGAKHLKGPQIPFYQYYYMDVICAIIVAISILFIVIYFVIKIFMIVVRYLMSKVFSNPSINSKKVV